MSLGHNVKMRAEKRWETRKTTVVTWPGRTSEISPPKARWMHHPFLGDGFLQPYGMISIVAWALSTLLLWFHELSNCWRKNILDVTVMTYSPEVISTNRRNRKYAFVISHLAYFQRASCKLCWKYFNCFHKKSWRQIIATIFWKFTLLFIILFTCTVEYWPTRLLLIAISVGNIRRFSNKFDKCPPFLLVFNRHT